MKPRERKVSIPGRCKMAWCRNPPRKKRHICCKCHSRLYKYNHTSKYAFNLLRCGAKRRGIAFGLTFEQWEDFWNKHPDLWEIKKKNILSSNSVRGRTGRVTWDVDRKDPNEGYFHWNIRPIQRCVNVARANSQRGWVVIGCTGSVVRDNVSDTGYICPY